LEGTVRFLADPSIETRVLGEHAEEFDPGIQTIVENTSLKRVVKAGKDRDARGRL
jgi:hypothetical protein